MRRRVLGFLGLLLMTAVLSTAADSQMVLVARDLEENVLSGFRFAYRGVESSATDVTGATSLGLPPDLPPGRQIKIQLVLSAKQTEEEWFLVDPQVNIPTGTEPAEVVLMRRSTFRQFAAEARDAPGQATLGSGETTTEDRKRTLVEAAAHYRLTEEQVEAALRSFAETQDPKDRGIAAYFEGKFSQAEDLLNKAAEKKESDYVETLQYLGASQYEQAKYRAAADTFRKAVALRGEDADLLGWLGRSFQELAEWAEAEPLIRRALAIDEERSGPDHPHVAIRLNNLASLLHETNRFAEAEPLMRRVLDIFEKGFGAEHPNVAAALNNLAQLLQATNRLAEAEPLMRRAHAIDEKSSGPDHPNVARDLGNLTTLLYSTNRLGEAEPLMRRALAIDEEGFGPDNPDVARDLNNLAHLLQATNRLGEAEPLMRRVLGILLEFDRCTGHEHPHWETASVNYWRLLRKKGKSQSEIEVTIEALVRSPEMNEPINSCPR